MEKQSNRVGILGMGAYLPQKVVTNVDIEKMVETSDEWIVQRTGISARRVVQASESSSSMGVYAARQALNQANLQSEDIDLIVVATITPDFFTPSNACVIQGELGAKNAAAFDINAACSGFITALSVASSFIENGTYKNVLVVTTEVLSRLVDWKDRNTCILFGDGAGAVVLSSVPQEFGIVKQLIRADGSDYRYITCPGTFLSEEESQRRKGENKQVLAVDGSEVMKFAVRAMVSSVHQILEMANMQLSDIDLIIPHQANIRIIEGASKRLDFDQKKIYCNISQYGNMSASSIPVALHDAYREGMIKHGDNIIFVAFGAGLTWGATLIRWYEKS